MVWFGPCKLKNERIKVLNGPWCKVVNSIIPRFKVWTGPISGTIINKVRVDLINLRWLRTLVNVACRETKIIKFGLNTVDLTNLRLRIG